MNTFEQLRYEKGATRREVASATKVAERTIRALEAGEIAKPSAPTAKALADFYEITVAELLGVEQKQATA